MPANASELLTNDSVKVWKLARRYNNETRMNMGDCFLVHRQHFSASNSFKTSSNGRSDCGRDLVAQWNFVKDQNGFSYIKLSSDQIPELMNIDEEFKLFKIKHLADTLMVLSFYHAQTTQTQTTMVDYLVPESASIKDRDFHW